MALRHLLAKGEDIVPPINVAVKAPFPIDQKLEERLTQITQDLIRKNLSDILIKSISANAETNIVKKTPKGYIVEILVMSLFRETYTAQLSRIEFSYEDEKVSIQSVESSFQPK